MSALVILVGRGVLIVGKFDIDCIGLRKGVVVVSVRGDKRSCVRRCRHFVELRVGDGKAKRLVRCMRPIAKMVCDLWRV